MLLLLAVVLGTWQRLALAAQEETGKEAAETERKPGPSLHFAAMSRLPEGEILIPLHFIAAPEETVGEIRLELRVPEGPWEFRKMELPEKSLWKVSVARRQRREEKGGEKPAPQTVWELTFSAGSRAIRNGWIGSLLFSVKGAGAPAPPSLEVAKLETAPPVAEALGGDVPFALPDAPPINPAQTCFFFTH